MRTKNELDKAIKDMEQGNAWDESDEVVQVEVKKPRWIRLSRLGSLGTSGRNSGGRLESWALARPRWPACGSWSACASE
ncbi:MAG: hypothetical protein NTW48_03860 [Chloroflexi bacterium]|nr:hypothetical protein [Chloroflexota bacterium]